MPGGGARKPQLNCSAPRNAKLSRPPELASSLYALVPWMWKVERMYSPKVIEVHFWLALSGTIIYVFAMWNSGMTP